MDIKQDILTRVGIVYILISVFGLSVVGKIVHIQFFDKNVERLEETKKVIVPKRGDIYSRDGKLLACSVPMYRIGFHYKYYRMGDTLFQNNVNPLASGLSRLYNIPERDKSYYLKRIYEAREKDGLKYFGKYKEFVDYNTKEEIKKLPILEYGPNKGGLHIEKEHKRVYPFSGIARRTIGLIQDDRGKTGLELYYDQYLYGLQGQEELDFSQTESQQNDKTVDGYDLITTIDTEMQSIANEELTAALKHYKGQWGCIIVMDVTSGEILAISNLQQIITESDTVYKESYNYAVDGICDPGSTIKLPSLMIALEDNVVDLDDTVDTKTGIINYFGNDVVDWNHKTHGGFGKLSVKDVFANSSNVGVTKIIYDNYVTTNREWDFITRLQGMSLDIPSGIDLYNEPKPNIKDPSVKISKENRNGWDRLSLIQMSYGYSIGLTPLQILNFYNAVANGGKMVRPHLVREIRDESSLIKRIEPEITNNAVCSQTTLDKVKIMLREVVLTGTGKSINNKYYEIAGKTGTAQTYITGKGYSSALLRGSFCGYFPANQPKYSMIIVIQSSLPYNPYRVSGSTAAKVFKKVSDRIYFTDHELRNQLATDTGLVVKMPEISNGYSNDYETIASDLNIPFNNIPESEFSANNANESSINSEAIVLDNELIPNFYEMGMRDAVYLAEKTGLKTEVKGIGKVYRQSIKAGNKLKKGETIVLELR